MAFWEPILSMGVEFALLSQKYVTCERRASSTITWTSPCKKAEDIDLGYIPLLPDLVPMLDQRFAAGS